MQTSMHSGNLCMVCVIILFDEQKKLCYTGFPDGSHIQPVPRASPIGVHYYRVYNIELDITKAIN